MERLIKDAPNARILTTLFGAFVVLALVVGASCERERSRGRSVEPSSTVADDPPETIVGLTVERLLGETVATYADAKRYSDEGYVEIVYERARNRAEISRREPCSTSFAKPNCARLEIGSALFRCDGKVSRAEILDDEFADRVLEREAPLVISSIKEFYPDPMFAEAAELSASSNVCWTSPQLVLLLAKDPLATLAPKGAKTQLLPPAYIRSVGENGDVVKRALCDRAKVSSADGDRTYWIDRATKLLARCELPVEGLVAPESGARIASVTMEFPNQKYSEFADDDLSTYGLDPLDPASAARRVERFLPFELDALDRAFPERALRVGLDEFDAAQTSLEPNRKTLLYFWSVDESNRARGFQTLAEVARDEPDVACVAVNVDGRDVADDVARANANAAGLTAPCARLDRIALMRADADFPFPPSDSFMLLDESRVVLRCARSRATAALWKRSLARARDGDDPASEDRNAYGVAARRFVDFINAADANDLYRTASELFTTQPALPRANPKRFLLREAWRSEDLRAPCAPIAVSARDFPSSAAKRAARPSDALPDDMLVVPCDGNAIALFSSDGRLLRKTTPAAALGEPISFVRSFCSADGERFYLASASLLSRKIHRFNETFADLGSIDVGRNFNQRVGDACFFTAPQRNAPALALGLVGDPNALSSSTSGVYAMESSTMRVLWKDETVLSPYRLGIARFDVASGASSEYLVSTTQTDGARCVLARFDLASGARELFPPVRDDDVVLSFSTPQASRAEYARVVALVESRETRDQFLVGWNGAGREAWRVGISRVELDARFDPIVCGDLDGDGLEELLVVSSTGAVQIFDASGRSLDYFQCGEEISGLCVAHWGDATYLAISGADRATVLRIDPRTPGFAR